MLFYENIKLALTAIRSNKMRSFLTMLGIIIGISSVIAITSIGASTQGAVNKEFESIGSGYMWLGVDFHEAGENGVPYEAMFTLDDVAALKGRFPDDIRYAAPFHQTSSKTKVKRLEGNLSITGVEANYNEFNKTVKLKYGRMISEKDVKRGSANVVLEIKGARYLFGREDVVGQSLPATVRGEPVDLTIVGVYEIPASVFSGFMRTDQYDCYVPYTLLVPGDDSFTYIEIYTSPDRDQEAIALQFAGYMEKVKNREAGYYKGQTAAGQLNMINKVLGVLSIAIGAIAAISLLVGGIGIMNIMLVSVTERTREIGIRKSLGAKTRDILTQFLIEAMILSVIGGIVGTILGLAIAFAGTAIAKVGLVISPSSVILAVVFSAAVGLFFGIFPAKKAAALDPIEALRYE